MNRLLFVLTATLLLALPVSGQNPVTPKKVSNVTLESLTGESTTLPMWGEKNLLIFYVDPDHPKQNEAFTIEMEEKHLAAGDNIYGFGILNLKDAPMIPNALACKLANNRTKKNGATVLADKDRLLQQAWGLGDCNNSFVMILVSKEGELVYVHKGEYTEEDKVEFFRAIDPYR